MKKTLSTFGISFLIVALSVSLAHAQTGGDIQYTPLEPGVITSPVADGTQVDFSSLIVTIFRLLFSLGALLAVGMITFFGIQYMVSDVARVKMVSTERLWAAALGLGILAGSYLILNMINPNLLKFNFDLDLNRPAQTTSSSQNTSGGSTLGGSNGGVSSSGENSSGGNSTGTSGGGSSSSGSSQQIIPNCGGFEAGGHISFYPKYPDPILAAQNAACAKACEDMNGKLVEVGRHPNPDPTLYSITYQCKL
jgi:hypothetical protein